MPLPPRDLEFVEALKLALNALNCAPRFVVPGAPEGLRDSYRICSHIEQVLKLAKGESAT